MDRQTKTYKPNVTMATILLDHTNSSGYTFYRTLCENLWKGSVCATKQNLKIQILKQYGCHCNIFCWIMPKRL